MVITPNIRSVSRCPVHPGRWLRVLYGPGSRRTRGAGPRTHAPHLAGGGRAHHGSRHMVDALRRHARLRAADAGVLRCRLDCPFPRAGDPGHERQLLLHQSPGRRIPPPPRPQRRLHGVRHPRHALHRHGGYAGARRIELRPPVGRALRDRRDRRGDGGAVAGVRNQRTLGRSSPPPSSWASPFPACTTPGCGRPSVPLPATTEVAQEVTTLDQTPLAVAIAGFVLADLAALFASVLKRKRADEALRQTQAGLCPHPTGHRHGRAGGLDYT